MNNQNEIALNRFQNSVRDNVIGWCIGTVNFFLFLNIIFLFVLSIFLWSFPKYLIFIILIIFDFISILKNIRKITKNYKLFLTIFKEY